MRFNSKLKSHTRSTTPPPPPSYDLHVLDETKAVDENSAIQTSLSSPFTTSHEKKPHPEKAAKENILTCINGDDTPEPPPATKDYPVAEPGPSSYSSYHQSEARYPEPEAYPEEAYSEPAYSTYSSQATYSEASSSVPASEIHSTTGPYAERSGTAKFTFAPIGTSAMVLLPSSGVQGSQPKYYITVSLNCFMPFSHITTVYRGADENSPRVCEFEMGIINVANSRIRMEEYLPIAIGSLLMKVRRPKDNARWVWKLPNNTSFYLLWDCSRVPFTCVAELARNAPPQLVARFTSHIQPITSDYRQSPPSVSQIEVLPAGRKCLDDILISLLIIERIRLTPNVKSLFNY